jgi:hypothetical protein
MGAVKDKSDYRKYVETFDFCRFEIGTVEQMSKRQHSDTNKYGVLVELTPFGTGFIEDRVTSARYGFHISMLRSTKVPKDARTLAGTEVTFKADGSGIITHVIAVRAHT